MGARWRAGTNAAKKLQAFLAANLSNKLVSQQVQDGYRKCRATAGELAEMRYRCSNTIKPLVIVIGVKDGAHQ